MILSCQGIGKSFGDTRIFENVSFHLEEREKAALIGNNGAGKTTLLKIIMGELAADEGMTILARDKSIGYLAQYQELQSGLTIHQELLATRQDILDMEVRLRTLEQEMKHSEGNALEEKMEQYTRLNARFEMENGYAYRSEIIGVLKGLGFAEEDFSKPVDPLSGGQ